MSPVPSVEQEAALFRLVGLPYVCLVEDVRSASRFVCQLSNGEKVRAAQIEAIFNAGLVVEALEGEGAATRSTALAGAVGRTDRLHGELLAHAQRRFGVTFRDALPIYLAMDRTEYGRWEDRPRVKWPKPAVN